MHLDKSHRCQSWCPLMKYSGFSPSLQVLQLVKWPQWTLLLVPLNHASYIKDSLTASM